MPASPPLASWTARLSLCALLAVGGTARAERIDRVVAVVGTRVVTEWDLHFEQSMQEHLGCPQPVLCDPGQDPTERLSDRAILRGLAGDTSTYRPEPAEVERRLAELRDSWQRPEDYQAALTALGLDEEELAGLLFSRMVVERYVQRHVGLPLASAGAAELLDPGAYSAAFTERYQAWIQELRGQVQVRIIEPLETP